MEKLTEINKVELISDDGYRYIITTYRDITEIKYYETENHENVLKETYTICSLHDIQICENILRLRKEYKEEW